MALEVEIESIHGDDHRMIFYRYQVNGEWRSYGPVITSDPDFDAESYKAVLADKLEQS